MRVSNRRLLSGARARARAELSIESARPRMLMDVCVSLSLAPRARDGKAGACLRESRIPVGCAWEFRGARVCVPTSGN